MIESGTSGAKRMARRRALGQRAATAAMATLCLAWWPGAAGAEAGKDLFQRLGCTKCHAIAAEGVAQKPGGKTKGPDLSGVGKKRAPEWLTDFLMKKVASDEGKKHKSKFKGSEAELQAMVGYLDGIEAAAPGAN